MTGKGDNKKKDSKSTPEMEESKQMARRQGRCQRKQPI
jgi:hypothetical protein